MCEYNTNGIFSIKIKYKFIRYKKFYWFNSIIKFLLRYIYLI